VPPQHLLETRIITQWIPHWFQAQQRHRRFRTRGHAEQAVESSMLKTLPLHVPAVKNLGLAIGVDVGDTFASKLPVNVGGGDPARCITGRERPRRLTCAGRDRVGGRSGQQV
jgi:hypothetical protein